MCGHIGLIPPFGDPVCFCNSESEQHILVGSKEAKISELEKAGGSVSGLGGSGRILMEMNHKLRVFVGGR